MQKHQFDDGQLDKAVESMIEYCLTTNRTQ